MGNELVLDIYDRETFNEENEKNDCIITKSISWDKIYLDATGMIVVDIEGSHYRGYFHQDVSKRAYIHCDDLIFRPRNNEYFIDWWKQANKKRTGSITFGVYYYSGIPLVTAVYSVLKTLKDYRFDDMKRLSFCLDEFDENRIIDQHGCYYSLEKDDDDGYFLWHSGVIYMPINAFNKQEMLKWVSMHRKEIV